MASHPGLEAAKQPQTITLPPPCFDCWYDVLFMKCCVGFTPDVTGHTPSKKFNFCPIRPQNICPKVSEIIKISLANVRRAFVFFLVSIGFCLETLPWMPFSSFLLLYHEHWPELKQVRPAVGAFMTSWMRRRCTLGVILVDWLLLERFTTVTSFLHLWIMALTMVRSSPKALEMAFTLSRLIHVKNFFLWSVLSFL